MTFSPWEQIPRLGQGALIAFAVTCLFLPPIDQPGVADTRDNGPAASATASKNAVPGPDLATGVEPGADITLATADEMVAWEIGAVPESSSSPAGNAVTAPNGLLALD